MRIVESGNEEPAACVDGPRTRVRQTTHLVVRADTRDPLATHRDCFGGGPRRVDGVHFCVDDNEVSSTGLRQGAGDHQGRAYHDEGEDTKTAGASRHTATGSWDTAISSILIRIIVMSSC